MRRRTTRARQRGFGTMEALVAAMLSLVVALAIMGFFTAQERAYRQVSTYAQSQNVTRTVVDLMAREIRMATYDPTEPAATAGAFITSPGPTCPGVERGLVVAMPQRIQIQQDLDGSGLIDVANENVMYAQVGDAIQRTDVQTGTTVTLVANVPANGFRIRYFDNQADPVELVPAGMPAALTQAQRDCVQKVVLEVHASLGSPVPNGADLQSSVRSGVIIRNRWIATSF